MFSFSLIQQDENYIVTNEKTEQAEVQENENQTEVGEEIFDGSYDSYNKVIMNLTR